MSRTSKNGKTNIDSHSKFVIGTQYMMYYEMINSNEESIFENLTHLIIKDFWMVNIGPYFRKSLWVAIFDCISISLSQEHMFLKVLFGALFIWTLKVVLLGLPNWKMTLAFVNVSVDVDLWGFLNDWTFISQRLQ